MSAFDHSRFSRLIDGSGEELPGAIALTQAQWARELRVHQTSVKNWSTGQSQPAWSAILHIAQAAGVSAGWLMGETDEPFLAGVRTQERETRDAAIRLGVAGAFGLVRELLGDVLSRLDRGEDAVFGELAAAASAYREEDEGEAGGAVPPGSVPYSDPSVITAADIEKDEAGRRGKGKKGA